MKKWIVAAGIVLTLINPKTVKADEIHTAWATAYCLKGTTASGTNTRLGIVASKKEWIGCTMVVWLDDGDGVIKPQNYLATYLIEDTGSKTIRSGAVIDVWLPTYEECMEFGSKRVIFQIIDGKG